MGFKFALVGWEREASSLEENLSKAERLVECASENRADAIGFVEYFSILGTDIEKKNIAERAGEGPVTKWAVESSRKHQMEIWCPFIELDEGGSKYNAVAIVDPCEGVVSTHHEFHYFTLEQQGLNVGYEIRTVQRPWGRLGCFICFDIHYPEVSRVIAMQGADVVFWPTLTRGPWSVEAVRKKACVRCMDNGFWLIESNLASGPPYAPYAGMGSPGSCVIDPEGNLVCGTGYRPGVVIADIDISRGSYGKGIVDSGVEKEDLRARFQDCLRPGYYAEAYRGFAARGDA